MMKKFILKSLLILSIVVNAKVNANAVVCQASFTATPDVSGYNYTFSNTSTGSYTNVMWHFGDGTSSTQLNPTHPYNGVGSVNCCLTIWDSTGSCQSSFCDSLFLGNVFGGGCAASFGYQNSGTTFYFYGSASNPTSAMVYYWTFGDGDSATGHYPTHNYAQAGTYNVCLTTTDAGTGCTDTYCHNVTVAPPPACQATFTYGNIGALNAFSFISQYSSNTATYSWDFGDGIVGTGHSISHTYPLSGTYNVCLTVSDPSHNCSATHCDTIIIVNSPSCQAGFVYNSTPLLVTVVSFTDLSVGNISNWNWSFGDGDSSTLQNPTHSYAQAGTYSVCLHISTGSCNSSICHNITVTTGGSTCNAFFGHQSNGGNTYYFSSNSSGFSHSWSFGDGTYSFLANPSHTYGAAGSYQVCHTVYDSMQTCTDTYCDSISINAGTTCTASFTYSTDSTGHNFSFVNTSSGGVLGTAVWSFGDGTASYNFNPTHMYQNSGAFIVCLTVFDPATGNISCSACQTIVVGSSSCSPVFYTYPDSNAVGNGNVNFGIYNSCPNTQFVWDFGDGTNGSGSNPTHQYTDSGWYYVCVTAYTPSGNFTVCDSVYAFRLTTSINEHSQNFNLLVYPNPVSGNGHAKFTLAENAHVIVRLMDMQGRSNLIILSEMMNAGEHMIELETGKLQNGIYILQLEIDNSVIHERISVMN